RQGVCSLTDWLWHFSWSRSSSCTARFTVCESGRNGLRQRAVRQPRTDSFATLIRLKSSWCCLQRSQVKHQLPSLRFRKLAERRYSPVCVSIRNFPKQSAIRLVLHCRKSKIGGMFFGKTCSIFTVTFSTVSKEELLTSLGGLKPLR
ncbi:MAG: hypothetical protein QOD84_49, partial [Acidobacteriaceae bacterium]